MRGHCIVALSGRVAAGKTTLADALVSRDGWTSLRTRDVIESAAGGHGRGELQAAGRDLDERTGGRWVADAARDGAWEVLIVDAVRIGEQIDGLRTIAPVIHVHLSAPIDVLIHRYAEKRVASPANEFEEYARVANDPVEARVEELAASADLVLDSHLNPPERLAAVVEHEVRRVCGF